MDLTVEQKAMIETAARFTQDRLRPNARAWDEAETLDREVLCALAELGFGGIYAGTDCGGSGLSRLDGVLIFEQLSQGCISHASFLSIHNMVNGIIDRFGAPALRRKWVSQLSSGGAIASYCLTEPDTGSDAVNLRTKAEREGDFYRLNGRKAFISGGGFSDVYLVMARTGGTGASGISALLVEKGTQGLSFGAREAKMGWRAQPTTIVNFDDCLVSAVNLVGEEGKGFHYAMAGLDGGRLNIAACSLGGAVEALRRSLDYARERIQFDKPIASFQAIGFKLADMETKLQAARALLYEAARKFDQGANAATSAFIAMAKRFATDGAFDIANEALQIHGGYGYLREYEIERIVRDLRVHKILEGTTEIMRMIIARHLLGKAD